MTRDELERQIDILKTNEQGLKRRLEAMIKTLNYFKSRTCDGCKHKPNDGENYYEPCDTCSRFYCDYWECKDD